MTNQENRWDQLFAQARQQESLVSYEETKKRLLPAIATGLVAGVLLKWGVLSSKLKLFIMISTISAISVATVLISTTFHASPEVKTPVSSSIGNSMNLDVVVADGITKKTYFDQNHVVIATEVDSSKKREISEIEKIPTSPIKPIKVEKSNLIEKTPTKDNKPVVKASSIQDTVQYTITQNTSLNELEMIQKNATQAGIDFEFTAKIRSSKIRKMKVRMLIERDGKATSRSTFSANGSTFDYSFGWTLDSEGKADNFIKETLKALPSIPGVKCN